MKQLNMIIFFGGIMERYISVDAGKFSSKIAEYNKAKKSVRTFQIRTAVCEGDFRDDAIEENTVVVKIGDKVYKVGNGASHRGKSADLDTNKQSEVHKICVLTALATLASANEKDEINVAVALPASDWASVQKREDFKAYILPEGEITVEIKKDSKSPVVKKTFVIKNKYAFAESFGALAQDGVLETLSPTSIIGVLDIGNLNLNATLWQGKEPLLDKSATAELGGAMLIQELSQDISTEIVPCNELITANILKSDDRALPEGPKVSPEMVEASRKLIKKALRDHAQKIKRVCRTKDWSLDVTRIVAIGGTSEDLRTELEEAFGNIVILPHAQYCNALGNLRLMCLKDEVLGELISISDTPKVVVEATPTRKEEKKAG